MAFLRALFVGTLVVGLACAQPLGPEDFYGEWGAENVSLTLSVTSATFETPCWVGDLTMPVAVSGQSFTSPGTISWQGGAGGSDTRLVTFRGSRDGDRLELTVSPSSLGLGPYVLREGQQGPIVGCP